MDRSACCAGFQTLRPDCIAAAAVMQDLCSLCGAAHCTVCCGWLADSLSRLTACLDKSFEHVLSRSLCHAQAHYHTLAPSDLL